MDIIFDVDGTLLDIMHRVPLIRPTNGARKDWKAFREAACNDVPNIEIVAIAQALWAYEPTNHGGSMNRIIICTGRMEKERIVTKASLEAAGLNLYDVPIYMRGNGDVRPDHEVKMEMLLQIRKDGYDPKLVFDDRQSVVDMWRATGLRVCQVAKGDF
jgi:hypothetical protein